LYFGDVVGNAARKSVTEYEQRADALAEADFVVANGENASGGIGIDPGTAREMLSAGIDVLTSGNHIWAKREIYGFLDSSDRLLRPTNFAPGVPGRGYGVFTSRAGVPIAVVNLIGRVFMGPADCPFRAADVALAALGERARVIFVDMHAEATSEKVAMGRYLDGRVSAVLGSHTHVPTADEEILPNGTAYLTDTGMSGPIDSVIGMRTDTVVRRFVDQLPARFEVGSGTIRVHGVLVDIDEATGKSRSIARFREEVAG
ncbi:MAG: TIGR00282 family metallophosphoesterase, partial [Candidatus Binatia bacterium]